MINAGSWLCVIEVDNKELENLINDGIIKGLSLFSYANGESRYMDVENKDDVYPLFISFVKYPANQVVFEVLDKDSYISKMEDVNLADKEKNLIAKIKDLISSAEAEEKQEEAPVEEKEVVDKAEEEKPVEQEVKEEVVEEKPVEEEKIDKAEEEPPIKEETQEKAPQEEKPVEEEKVVEKDCNSEEVVQKDDEITGVTNDDILNAINDLKDAILQALVPEEPIEEEIAEEVVEEEPETYIIKQATQKTDVIEEQKVEKKQYFDILGRKL